MKISPVKPPILLKTLLDILFWFSLIGLILQIIFTGLYFFSDIPFNISLNEYEITEFDLPVAIGISLKILISGMFIYVIYLFRKLVRSFFKKKLFTPLQISGLNLIGKLIVFIALAEIALDFLIQILFDKKASVGIELDASFNSIWFTLAVGLFFILLSKAFTYAGHLQQENELTV